MKKISIFFSFLVSSTILYSANSLSDDIDIYTKVNSAGKDNNIMFMIDTSGSMSANVDGTNMNRLQAVQNSMFKIINGLNENVKVGVGAYNGYGGSIVYPVKRLGDNAKNISISSIYESEDDGLETENGEVHTQSQALGFGLNEYDQDGNVTIVDSIVNKNSDNAVQCTNENNFYRNPNYLYLGMHSSCNGGLSLGVKFENLDIPKNAKIKKAVLVFNNSYNNASKKANTKIYLEKTSNPLAYYYQSSSQIENISDLFRKKRTYSHRRYQRYNYDALKNYYSDTVDWEVTGGNTGEKTESVDLSELVQKLVNDDSWVAGSSSMNFSIRTENNSYNDLIEFSSFKDNNNANRPKLIIHIEGEDKNFNSNHNLIGLNFKTVKISSNSEIEKAELQITSDFDYSDDEDNIKKLKIKLVDPRDTGSLSNTNKLSTRRILAEKVFTFSADSWGDGEVKRFDIKDLIKENVSSEYWCGGQDVTLILEDMEEGWKKLKSIKSFDNARKREVFTSMYIVQGEESDNSCMIRDVTYNINNSSNDGDVNNINSNSFKLGITKAALRFENINLSSDDKIISAKIELNSNDSGNVAVRVYSDISNDNNPSEYNSNTSNDINNRTEFGTSKALSFYKNSNSKFELNSLEGLIQNTINKSNWNSGKSMSFIIFGDGSNRDFNVKSFESGEANKIPKLKIRFKSKNKDSKEKVKDKIVSLVQQMQYGGGTPTLGSTIEAYKYFKEEAVYNGRYRNRNNNFISESQSWKPTDTAFIKTPVGCGDLDPHNPNCIYQEIIGDPIYDSPIIDSECETNSIIMLTDGEPSNSPYLGLTSSITGESCNNNWDCIHSITRYMANNDMREDLSSTKNITTNVIGFAMGSNSNMHQYAEAGNGAFYTVFNSEALVNTITTILEKTIESNTTLAMPGVSVDQSNRLQFKNDLYFSVFKPQDKQAWSGNLKKYKIKKVEDSESNEFNIVDQFEVNAVDKSTGFFKDGSQSIWSSTPDGLDSELGGAASNMDVDRNIFTYVSSEKPNNTILSGDLFRFVKDNSNLTRNHFTPTDDLDDREVDEVDSNGNPTGRTVMIEEYSKFLNWINGYDEKDSDNDDSITDARYEMSDPLHSKPIVVDYNDNDATVFVSTNDGTLHGIDAKTGEELFAFVPERVLPNLYNKYKNGAAEHQYGLDLTWSAYKHDSDKNGDIDSANDFVYIYGGMRRGGDSLYALDVTNIQSSNLKNQRIPKFKWEINPSTSSEFSNMGQTWSTPILTKVKYNGRNRVVMIFGGGYDTINDSNNVSLLKQKGNQIYMLDAKTGELLWWASDKNSNANVKIDDMKYSIPNKISAIDVNNDGYLDYLYANDVAGQIFKFKINIDNNGSSSFAKGKVFSKLGITNKANDTNNRKFFEKIALIPVIDSTGQAIYVISGTGDRPNPISKMHKDGVFVIRDKEIDPNNFSVYSNPIIPDDLVDVTHTKNETQIIADMETKDGYVIWLNEGLSPKDLGFEGEKVIGSIIVANEKLVFSTYVPDNETSSCESKGLGNSRKYVVNIYTGAPERLSSKESLNTSQSVYKQRYITEPLPGFSSGTKILYTEDGVIAISNTSISAVDDIQALGMLKDKWERLFEKVQALIPPHIYSLKGN